VGRILQVDSRVFHVWALRVFGGLGLLGDLGVLRAVGTGAYGGGWRWNLGGWGRALQGIHVVCPYGGGSVHGAVFRKQNIHTVHMYVHTYRSTEYYLGRQYLLSRYIVKAWMWLAICDNWQQKTINWLN